MFGMDTTPIPKRLRGRPRVGGLPVPFANQVGPDGRADFRTLDGERRQACLDRNLCGLCGQQLGRPVVLIGSPADVELCLFFDPAMHEECALYAVAACPYLANPNRQYSKLQPKFLPPGEQVDTSHQGDDISPAERLALVYAPAVFGREHRGTFFFAVAQKLKVDWETIPHRM